jgi:two-component system phosphate regulon response regulator PhoB
VLVCDPGRAFTRSELIAGAWPARIFVETRTVNVHMARLRGALRAAHAPELIRTVRGTGYAFDGDPSSRAHSKQG